MDWRVALMGVVAVAAGGCAEDNPLFGLDGSGTATSGLVDDTTGPLGVPDETGVDDTRGKPGGNSTDTSDPTSPDDDDNDDNDDSVDTDDDDDDVASESGPGCPPADDCVLDNESCGNDEKCALYGSGAFGGPDAIGCTPLHPSAAPLGGRCEVNGCGFDDCGVGLFCPRDDDAAECIPLCSVANLDCDQQGTCINVLGAGATVGACVPTCDLVEQNCLGAGQGCYQTAAGVVCSMVGDGVQGDSCEFADHCAAGLACVNPSALPDCMATACCTEHCTVGEDTCPEPLSCQSAQIVGMPTVGVCVI